MVCRVPTVVILGVSNNTRIPHACLQSIEKAARVRPMESKRPALSLVKAGLAAMALDLWGKRTCLYFTTKLNKIRHVEWLS